MVFFARVHLTLFLALFLSPGNSLVSSWCELAYCGHTMWKQGSCLEKEKCKEQCRVHVGEEDRTAWMDNVYTWTGLSVEESVRMTEDRDKWRKYVHGVAKPRI